MSALSSKSRFQPDVWKEYVFAQAISEKDLEQVSIEVQSVQKRLRKLKAVSAFLCLQVSNVDALNCFVSRIIRTKTDYDDIATLMIKTEKFERFDICINTKNDFKVQEIACKVHNLTQHRRKLLVESMRKYTGPDAHIKRIIAIHRARNFEIRKV
jgi:hypothetical protein